MATHSLVSVRVTNLVMDDVELWPLSTFLNLHDFGRSTWMIIMFIVLRHDETDSFHQHLNTLQLVCYPSVLPWKRRRKIAFIHDPPPGWISDDQSPQKSTNTDRYILGLLLPPSTGLALAHNTLAGSCKDPSFKSRLTMVQECNEERIWITAALQWNKYPRELMTEARPPWEYTSGGRDQPKAVVILPYVREVSALNYHARTLYVNEAMSMYCELYIWVNYLFLPALPTVYVDNHSSFYVN